MEEKEKKKEVTLRLRKTVGGDVSAVNNFWRGIMAVPPNEKGEIDGPSIYLKKNTEKVQAFSDKKYEQLVGKVVLEDTDMDSLEALIGGRYEARIVKMDGRDAIVRIVAEEKAPVPKKDKNTLLEEAILRTGLSKEELQARLDLISYYGIKPNSFMFQRIVETIARQPEGEQIERPSVLYQQDEKQQTIKTLLIAASRGCNYVLEGAKSVGKNVAWETMSYILNRKLFAVQCERRMSKEDVLGRVGTDNTRSVLTKEEISSLLLDYNLEKANGRTGNESISAIIENVIANLSPRLVINYGPVGRAILHENAGFGSILLLDEMNLSDPGVFTSLFNILTDRHSQYIEFDTQRLPIPRTMVIGGTQNSLGGEYLGTNALNGAAMSRWGVIKLSPPKSIMSLLKTVPDSEYVSDEDLNTLNRLYEEFVILAKDGRCSDAPLNIRGFKAAVEMIACGIPVCQAVLENVVNSIQDVDEVEDLTELVRSLAV